MEYTIVLLMIGLATGILSGLLGIGGGVILVPMLVLLLQTPQHLAQGISMLVIIPTAITALWKLRNDNLIQWNSALYLALGSILGALAGGLIVQYVADVILTKIFGILILLTGIRMIRRNNNA